MKSVIPFGMGELRVSCRRVKKVDKIPGILLFVILMKNIRDDIRRRQQVFSCEKVLVPFEQWAFLPFIVPVAREIDPLTLW